MKIRSVTLFADAAALSRDTQTHRNGIARLGTFAATARRAFETAGYEVQTTRLATNLFAALDHTMPGDKLVEFVVALEALCREQGFEFIALGPAEADNLMYLPDILAATQSVFATTAIVDHKRGVVDGHAIRAAAHAIQKASRIEDGFGNLRFAAMANVPPATPFFPSAYHGGGAPSFAIATESADLALTACREAGSAEVAHERLQRAITEEARCIVDVADVLVEREGMPFGGIDFSLAPYPTPEASIGAAVEALTGQPLGAAGSLAAAATLTSAIDLADFPHTGFCGMMLPVLEDAVIAKRAAEGRLDVGNLLQWSAVCGTGLDTVPLPGDVSEDALARVLFDVASLSVRLHKPLTARLMPLPGKDAGDAVHFDFAYFADGGVLALNGEERQGAFANTNALKLHSRGYPQE